MSLVGGPANTQKIVNAGAVVDRMTLLLLSVHPAAMTAEIHRENQIPLPRQFPRKSLGTHGLLRKTMHKHDYSFGSEIAVMPFISRNMTQSSKVVLAVAHD